ncbi:MAG: ligase-associated DNA damage response endonuclease PdeM [Pseudomonadota bacterium]
MFERISSDSFVPGTALAIEWAGEVVWLLPQHALWWPARGVLFVADLHIGKAATYRSLGQPVPSGTTQENLRRLAQLFTHYKPKQVIFLGDFLHAPQARTPAVLSQLMAWRADFSSLRFVLVRGNHDLRAGDPPAALDIDLVDEPWLVGPFAACHHPQRHATHAVLSGHLHPVLRLHGRGREHLRLPCFCFDEGQAVLPAFGEFTGGWAVQPRPGVTLYPAGGNAVWKLPVVAGTGL